MKKVLIICSVFLSLYGLYKINRKEEVKPVSINTSFSLEDYNVFYLNLEEADITSINLNKILLSNTDVISITPFVNPIYKKKVGDLKYKFDNISFKRNINKFTEYYVSSIKKIGINDNFNTISENGIKINELEIYAPGSDIVNMIYNHPKIKYKKQLNGTYEYLDY